VPPKAPFERKPVAVVEALRPADAAPSDTAPAKRRDKLSVGPKGPPPPVGKPNSKKNKARAKLNTRAGRKALKAGGPPAARKP
jgi:ATP-dependent RNA helicase DeaD